MSELVLKDLLQALSEAKVLHGVQIGERYRTDWSYAQSVDPLAVVRAECTEDVAEALKICHQRHHPVTVQGGMTGLVGGSQARTNDVVISLEKLNGIEEIDLDASTMTVRAGTPLQVIQEAALEQGLYFAVDLGARGSCQVGGNIATNAGGNKVIRYGMMREQVLGLEVVLADGTVVTQLNKMIKNNAGYDLKQWFIGSEGTLGVITRAVLRLFPAPGQMQCALCVLADYDAVLKFLSRCRRECGSNLLAFEAMWPDFYGFMTQNVPNLPCPVQVSDQLVVLIECDGGASGLTRERFETMIGQALEEGEVVDAVIAESLSQAQAFWSIRDSVSAFPRLIAPYASFDISIAIRQIGQYVDLLKLRLAKEIPSARSIHFGHIGDSNLHVVVHCPASGELFPKAAIERVVYGLVGEFNGSISAEHGIGTRKKAWLGQSRSQAEIDLMRRIKLALDPHGILNPGKVI